MNCPVFATCSKGVWWYFQMLAHTIVNYWLILLLTRSAKHLPTQVHVGVSGNILATASYMF